MRATSYATSAARRQRAASVLLIAACAACSAARPDPTPAPETGRRLVAAHGMVASASPYASDAGVEMLRRGGNAVDAAVATAFAVGVVEPMMAGIGAGGGMLVWLQHDRRAEYLDFYATAGADGDTALNHYRGSPVTARAAAVPGAVAGLLDMQAKYGKLPRAVVLEPAIRLAADGFPVHSLLAREIAKDSAALAQSAGAHIFLPGGKPIAAGTRLVQPELAASLRLIAAQGKDAFYTGEIAREIVRALNDGGNPITMADLASFTPRPKRPLCAGFEGRVVLSAPPPQGGMQVLEALRLLAPQHLPSLGLPSRSPDAFRVLAAALRVSVADRNAYVGDPGHAPVPAAGITSAAYAARRQALIGAAAVPDTLAPGDPWPDDAAAPEAACAPYAPYGPSSIPPRTARASVRSGVRAGDEGGAETTHMSVVDADGNAVSLTFTNGRLFGSGTWAAGTFLNSAMLNFSRADTSANARGPHRVPASTISPTIVLADGRVRMVVGSPGSMAIPPAIVETIVYSLDYGMDPMQALEMPRVIPYPTSMLRMEDGFSPEVLEAAHRLGYDVQTTPPADMFFGGVQVIERVGGRWVGAADPRRDGEVRGY